VLNTQAAFESVAKPFTLHLAQGTLSPGQVEKLYKNRPRAGFRRIEICDPGHEKQYAMNLLYLQQGSTPGPGARALHPAWAELLEELRGDAFVDWLEAGTGSCLRGLPTDIGIYTHEDGDFISVHKDKPHKALTAILYLNPRWPLDGGGLYEVRESGDPADAPARRIPPVGGQFLAFPPSEQSWHSVSPLRTGGTVTRLTVQLEYWLGDER
jgi:2OG-Fe(II) oxygenase superfamily